MRKLISAAHSFSRVFQSLMRSPALALLLYGWVVAASAQEAVHVSHETVVLSDCQDLMKKIRQQYGRAPLCLKVVNPGGPSLTDLSGLVGLADDMNNPWYEMQFTTDVVDPTLYHYGQSDLNNVIALIRYSHRGLTETQMLEATTSSECEQVQGKLAALRNAGTFTEQQYQYALGDFRKTAKECAK